MGKLNISDYQEEIDFVLIVKPPLKKIKNVCQCCFEEESMKGYTVCKACNETMEENYIEDIKELLNSIE